MADNFVTNAGSGGNTYASDDIAGVHHPRVKISLGVDGVATDAPGDGTNGMDVDVTRLPSLPAGTNNIGDVDVLTLPALPAGTNNIGDVDILTVPAPLSTTGGGTEATALRVTLANDSTGVLSVDDNGGSITVDGTVTVSGTVTATLTTSALNIGDVDVLTLPSTTNAGATAKTSDYDTGAGTDAVTMMGIALPASGGAVQGGTATNPVRTDPTGTTTQPVSGTVTANLAAGTNNIGDVDVVTLPALPAGTNNIGDVDVLTVPAPLSTAGGGTEATALRVTIANDSTGVVSIDDNGGSITIDGTVAVSGTVTVGSHAVTNAGTFATQESGAALTALQLIDDLVLTEDAPHVSGDPGVMLLGVRKDTAGTLASLDGDYTPIQFDSTGNVRVNVANIPIVNNVQIGTTTGNGITNGKVISAASTNATVIKSTTGNLYFLSASNTNASPRYLKLYAKSTAPTVGTDVPFHVFMIPGNSAGAGTNLPIPGTAITFNAGLGIAITTGAPDSDTGAVAANEIIVNYSYR